MHVIINRIHFGNCRFIVELEADTGEEAGLLTLWVAEKIDVRVLPFYKFTIEQLIYAMREPRRSRLYHQLEVARQELHDMFVENLAAAKDLKPRHLRKRVHELQREYEKALMQVERAIRQNELLTLDKSAYDLEILQAESNIFAEERFLCQWKENEVDESMIRQACFEYAFDEARRVQMQAEAARQPQPDRPVFEEERDLEEG